MDIPKKNIWRLLVWVFLQARCLCCHPNNSIKTMKEYTNTLLSLIPIVG